MENSKIKNRFEKVKTYFSQIKERVKGKSKSAKENVKKAVLEKERRDTSAI